MLRKKKRKILNELAHLTAIQNDYVLSPDSEVAAKLIIAIANDIGGVKGGDYLLEEAIKYTNVRHGNNAENSTPIVGGKEHEEKKIV